MIDTTTAGDGICMIRGNRLNFISGHTDFLTLGVSDSELIICETQFPGSADQKTFRYSPAGGGENFQLSGSTGITGSLDIIGPTNAEGNITASGDISASGDLYIDEIQGSTTLVESNDGGDVSFTIRNSAGGGSTDETSTLNFGTTNTANTAKIVGGRDGTYSIGGSADGNLQFYTRYNGTDTEKMRINNIGKVGMGTSALDTNSARLTVAGDISGSGKIHAISASFGALSNTTRWSDGYHGNDEFIPLFLHDFDFANDSTRGALNYSTNEGGAIDVLYAPYESLAAKIIPKGYTAVGGVIYGNNASCTHNWYSSSLDVGTTGNVDATLAAINSTETFANRAVGDGETYIICQVTTNHTSDEIYGGKIFIERGR
jgi:hypothetical protein